MSVLIASASIDERGKAYGGLAGDQTGREVLVRTWYTASWDQLIRPLSPALAERMASFAEKACANDHIGYNQYRRNTLRTYAKAVGWDATKIVQNCDTDCSAFVTVCVEAAGINVDTCYTSGNAPVTQNIAKKLMATGAFELLTDKKYFSSDRYLKRGDILNRSSGHVVLVLSNGSGVITTAAAITTPSTPSAIAVGDTVQFLGGRHYPSSGMSSGVEVKAGPARVTYIKAGALHPYHVIHTDNQSSVYGWVDAGVIQTAKAEKIHHIVTGDTFWGIARKYGVDMVALAAYNGMNLSSMLYPGRTLRIP